MRWLRRSRLRRLSAFDKSAAIALLDQNPVATILARVPIEQDVTRPAHALGLFDDDGNLTAVCWNGANLVPYGFDDNGLDILADHLLSTRQLCNSLVGPADQVMPLWERVQRGYSKPRGIREHQLSMVYKGTEQVAPDPQVRPAELGEGGLVVPASVAIPALPSSVLSSVSSVMMVAFVSLTFWAASSAVWTICSGVWCSPV